MHVSRSRAGGPLWLRLALLVATLLPFPVRVFAAAPPLVPDTPAGHILQLWLDAFETTGGGAHPMSGAPIDDHVTLALPGGRLINPVTKGDWEGTGVKPDVAVPAPDALETAKKLAIERLEAK